MAKAQGYIKKNKSILDEAISGEERFLKLGSVSRMAGMSRPKIIQLMESNQFPSAYKINGCSHQYWKLSEVRAWQKTSIGSYQ